MSASRRRLLRLPSGLLFLHNSFALISAAFHIIYTNAGYHITVPERNGYDPPKSAFICRFIYPVSLSGENHIKDLSLGLITPTVRGNPQ